MELTISEKQAKELQIVAQEILDERMPIKVRVADFRDWTIE